MSQHDAMVRVVDLKKHFPITGGLLGRQVGAVKAVDGISLEIGRAETLGLVGESGCGKSTAGRAVLQLHTPTSGQVYLEDAELTKLSANELRKLRPRMQMIFQDPYGTLNPRHSVGKIIADEPTTALDVTVQAQIVDLFRKLRSELRVAIIWITHDLGVVAGIADRVLVMYGGLAAEIASVDDLYEQPQHPYTLGLLGALPSLDTRETTRLVSIKGAPPDMLLPLVHCPFAWRCDYAFDRCWEEIPPLTTVDLRHQAACFYDLEKGGPRDV
jgi:oligopeptide/dipeptide ABC transporter ATP-binding protein